MVPDLLLSARRQKECEKHVQVCDGLTMPIGVRVEGERR